MLNLIFFAICIILYGIFELPYNLSILQLESYKFTQYLTTKYHQCKLNFIRLFFSVLACFLLFLKIKTFIIFPVYFLVCIVLSIYISKKHKIKRYIYTKRILRYIVVFILLSILAITIYLLSKTNNINKYCNMIMTISVYILYIMTVCLNGVFEKILSIFFIEKAKNKIKTNQIKIIGITGSYGKTSVKKFLYELLLMRYNVVMSPKSYNTLGGLCKTINETDLKGVDYLILEMGADKCGDIKSLCSKFTPEYGILTAIGEQHLKGFKTIDNVYKTKCELQQCLTGEKFMVFNCYNDLVKKASENYKGEKSCVGKDIFINNFNSRCDGFSCDIKTLSGEMFGVNVPLLGFHNAINISLAIAMALRLGVSHDEIMAGLTNVRQVESRMEVIKRDNNVTILNNGYNSNPQTARCSLEVIKNYPSKKVIITPGFVELGKEQYKFNYEFGKEIAAVCNEVVIVNKANKFALFNGLKESGFDMDMVTFADHFGDIDFSGYNDCVILIENDLPSNYL